ncbi:ABC transporter ATP-binding protein [Virgisporangium ochraceum]
MNPGPASPPAAPFGRLVLDAVRLGARGAKGPLVLVVAVTLVGAVVPTAVAWLTSVIIDQLAGDGVMPAGRAWTVCLALAGASLVAALLPLVTEYAEAEFGRRVGLVAQDELYRALDRFGGLARFEDPAFHNRLAVAQASGGAIPGHVIGSGLRVGQALIGAVSFVVTIALMVGWLVVFLVAAAVPMLLAELRLARHLAALTYRVETLERRERFFASLICDLRAAKEVRLFRLGPWLRGRVRRDREAINAGQRALDRRRLAVLGWLRLLSSVTALAGLLWTVNLALRGELSTGDIAMFLAAVAGVQGALAVIASSTASMRRHTLLFGHYRAVVTAPADLAVPATPRPLPPLHDGIELRDVWFRYGEDQPWVLRGVDLTIPKGSSLALVGSNGAGKSTLVKLLCRFYDPQRGSIRWDGVDLRDVPPADLRDRMAVIFQDFMQYELSAAENIGVGDLTRASDPAAVPAAAGRAGIHDVLAALPDGYRTMLSRSFEDGDPDHGTGGSGVLLSGGQWQRVALARALVRQPRDLALFDEPSSGLDPRAEHDLYRDLYTNRLAGTLVTVTHRLGSVRRADLVAVMDRGTVVECGDHDTLVARPGWYATMFGLQADSYRAGAGR